MCLACAIARITEKFLAHLEGMCHLSPVPPDAPIRQSKANSDKYAERICNPVVHVCTAVEGGLYQLNNGAKGALTNKHWQQT